MKILVTGGAGFIGSAFVRMAIGETDLSVINLDKLTYAGNLLNPSSPYSASKAASDLLVRSYFVTFKLPVMITRASNNYGPYQFPEKLIPLMITNALEDRSLPVYGDGQQVRDWLYVEDHCKGILAVLRQGREGEIYNIGGNRSLPNLEVVHQVLKITGKPESLISYVKDR